jgi:hypothetical protein
MQLEVSDSENLASGGNFSVIQAQLQQLRRVRLVSDCNETGSTVKAMCYERSRVYQTWLSVMPERNVGAA